MKEISYEEWYELIEKVHVLDNRTAGLLAVVIIAFVLCASICLLSWALDYDKKKDKKDKKNDRETEPKNK